LCQLKQTFQINDKININLGGYFIMARQRKLTEERKNLINQLLATYQPEDAKDVQSMLKDLLGDTLQGMLESELDEELGYSKYDYANKETDNRRNGYSRKTVTSSMGNINLDIPRDRDGEFEPQIVKKHQTDISSIEDQVLSMYAKGMTTRDITEHLQSVYGVEASPVMISKMTDKILPIAKEWQNRPLERKYAIVFMDAVHYNVRQDNTIIKKAVYIAIGIRLDGTKEVIGMWVGGNESAKYWLGILNEIKNRGTEDILIISVDGLTGFSDAIHAVYPETEIQRCIVHQIRYSTRFISYKDIRSFMVDLKLVYQANTEDIALQQLEALDNKWGKKYPSTISSWRNNWADLSTFFKYPPELRKIIYTTNSIENFNRQLRKVTKSKSIFPTDDALFKMLYLAMQDITAKWKGRPRDWTRILEQLLIYFDGRISLSDIE
jgi:putative transposase